MIETLTTAAISLAGLAGLAIMYSALLSDQNKRIARIKKDIGALEQENKTLCKPDVVFELQKDLQERCDRAIALKEENTQLKQDLLRTEELQDEIIQLEKDFEIKDNLLSEISQHIGNKPSSSTYKYFRGKLNALEIREDE